MWVLCGRCLLHAVEALKGVFPLLYTTQRQQAGLLRDWEEYIFVSGVPIRYFHLKAKIFVVYYNQCDMTMATEAQHGRKKSIIVRVARMYVESPDV